MIASFSRSFSAPHFMPLLLRVLIIHRCVSLDQDPQDHEDPQLQSLTRYLRGLVELQMLNILG